MYRHILSSKSALKQHSTKVFQAGMIMLFLGFVGLDQTIELLFQHESMKSIYYYSREITNIGYASHYFAIAGILFVVSHFFSHLVPALKSRPLLTRQLADGSSFALKSLFFGGLVVQLTKVLVGRARPHLSADQAHLEFEPLNIHWHWHSFPSGHTQVMFTVGTVLSLIWPKYTRYFFIGAALFAFTRVAIHQHFFSDFIGGILAGYLTTIWVYWKWPPQTLQQRLK